tara:strand:+ start:61 stop:258 length:198 start_codon:yes stop_codon:yes gene_type:complete
MKISDDKLKLFDLEGDLKDYLKINGLKDSAVDEHITRWKSIDKNSSTNEKTTMVVTETDTAVETK